MSGDEFWDSSVVTPIFVDEPDSAGLRAAYEAAAPIFVWRGTPVEVASAIGRRFLEARSDLGRDYWSELNREAQEAFRSDAFTVIDPHERMFDLASGLVFRHRLRAADALQLAAALDLKNDLAALAFRCADLRLADAARAEGFVVS